jgi:hypothetical protein
MFRSIFQTEVYFDQNLEVNLSSVTKISYDLFEALSLEAIELGWVSIFALDKLVIKEDF